jgi:hypothetical protein
MRGSNGHNLVLLYISLAIGVVILGAGITFAVLAFCAYYNIDISRHWWLLGIPVFLSLLINVLLIELVRKLIKK